eukprot:2494046-Pyramimonas_sp.AAC.1
MALGSVQKPESKENTYRKALLASTRTLSRSASGALGKSPAALLKRCQERFHACLHACTHAWTLAGSAPGPAAGSGEALRDAWRRCLGAQATLASAAWGARQRLPPAYWEAPARHAATSGKSLEESWSGG